MVEEQEHGPRPQKTSRKQIHPGFIVAGIAAAIVVTCLVGLGIFALTGPGRTASYDSTTSGMGVPQALPPMEPAVEKVADMDMAESESEEAAYGASNVVWAAERLIVRSGNISMVVEDTRGAKESIEQMVARMAGEGAFVVSSEEYGGAEESQPYISMSIRVPAARFDETMDRLAGLAVTVTSQGDSAQDVTEEYVDLEARLESLEAARQRLLDIMAEARTTKDLLEAEQQLTQREAEIESIKGRKQYLEESARLSTIWIELQPHILSQPVGDQWRPAETLRQALDTLLDGLRGFGDFLIFFGVAVLPWLVLLALAIYVVVRLIRWRVRVQREKSAPREPAA